MPAKNENTRIEKPSSAFLKKITGNIGGITAMILAIVTLLGALEATIDGVTKTIDGVTKLLSLLVAPHQKFDQEQKDCFIPKISIERIRCQSENGIRC